MRQTLPVIAIALLATAGCSNSPAAADAPAAAAHAGPARMACADDQASRSLCMIRMILADLAPDLTEGGISEIRALSSDSYVVSWPREERVTRLTYRFAFGKGVVTLLSRTEGTESF